MKTQHIITLSALFIFTITLGFGMQNCSKKENFDPMEIVGKWELYNAIDRSRKIDLSICSKEDLLEYADKHNEQIPKIIEVNKNKKGVLIRSKNELKFSWFYHDQEAERRSYMIRFEENLDPEINVKDNQLHEKLQLAYQDEKKDPLKKNKSYKLLYYPANLPAPKTMPEEDMEQRLDARLDQKCLVALGKIPTSNMIYEYERK